MLKQRTISFFSFLGFLIAVLLLLTACALPVATVETGGGLTSVPTSEAPILGIIAETSCHYGPGTDYEQVTLLDPGQYFGIVGIDDDVSWIDDDITWFQIDPTAVINPDPPGRPPDELSLPDDSTGSDMFVRCWVPGDRVETSGDLTLVPVIQVPVLGVIEATGCYSGPDADYEETSRLDPGQFFRILAVDDDITWIDDDITWLQVKPTALIDPDPPHRPLNELSPQPDPPGSTMTVRCWVPGDRVETSGDLSMLPVVPAEVPPSVRILVDANCRSGPSMDYMLLSVLPAGGQYEIQARNTAGDSWMVLDPAIANPCWIYGDLVEVIGDTSLVMIIDPEPPGLTLPPTETTVVVDCSQYNTDPTACGNDSACWWDPTDPPQSNGSCKNK